MSEQQQQQQPSDTKTAWFGDTVHVERYLKEHAVWEEQEVADKDGNVEMVFGPKLENLHGFVFGLGSMETIVDNTVAYWNKESGEKCCLAKDLAALDIAEAVSVIRLF